jgi:hypothetical protein
MNTEMRSLYYSQWSDRTYVTKMLLNAVCIHQNRKPMYPVIQGSARLEHVYYIVKYFYQPRNLYRRAADLLRVIQDTSQGFRAPEETQITVCTRSSIYGSQGELREYQLWAAWIGDQQQVKQVQSPIMKVMHNVALLTDDREKLKSEKSKMQNSKITRQILWSITINILLNYIRSRWFSGSFF